MLFLHFIRISTVLLYVQYDINMYSTGWDAPASSTESVGTTTVVVALWASQCEGCALYAPSLAHFTRFTTVIIENSIALDLRSCLLLIHTNNNEKCDLQYRTYNNISSTTTVVSRLLM